jgi:hypothetical protein
MCRDLACRERTLLKIIEFQNAENFGIHAGDESPRLGSDDGEAILRNSTISMYDRSKGGARPVSL